MAIQDDRFRRFKLLETFYEGLEAAASLLRIRHQMCTFRAVCKVVESMSRRRFLLKHLAQIKYIFSEVLQLEYVRCQDPDSWGEKWDLRITLLPLSSDCAHSSSPLKGSAGQTRATIRRRKEFHARLLKLASSHPEDGDIPQDPLPLRPLGGQLAQSSSSAGQPASSSSHLLLESSSSDRNGNTEGSVGSLDAESTPNAEGEEFQFSIVKPSRASDPILAEGTSHFPASFRPFFSVKQTPELVDGVHEEFSKPDQPDDLLPGGSHFPASFRPFFSIKRTAEAIDGVSASPKNLPRPEAIDGVFASPKNLPQPEAIDDVSASPKNLPQPSSTVEGTPKLRPDDSPVSPIPIHTPPILSPMRNSLRTSQDSPNQATCKTPTPNSSNYLPPKSRSTMRSLRFGSPISSSITVKTLDSDIATLQTPAKTSNSKEVLYSPPKRTRFSLKGMADDGCPQEPSNGQLHAAKDTKGSLKGITDDGCPQESLTPSNAQRHSAAKAIKGSLKGITDDGCPQEPPTPSNAQRHSAAKEIKGISQSDLDIIQCLPLDLVQSVQEKERKINDECSKKLAKQKRRQQMMGGVPKLFNQLRLIFQSLNRSVLPQHELVKSILTSHPDITDKGEVEERLRLVIELAPDYITTRSSHTGELLYRIDKRADVVRIQKRISGAC